MTVERLTDETMTNIIKIIDKGNACEVKREKDQIVVVEIIRKVKNKTPING